MPTLAELKEQHPCIKAIHEATPSIGFKNLHTDAQAIFALTTAKLEDEKRIVELADFKERVNIIASQTSIEEPKRPENLTPESLQKFIGEHHLWGREGWARANSLEAQLTAEQQTHAATREELRQVDEALIELGIHCPSDEWVEILRFDALDLLAERDARIAELLSIKATASGRSYEELEQRVAEIKREAVEEE